MAEDPAILSRKALKQAVVVGCGARRRWVEPKAQASSTGLPDGLKMANLSV
jgi:hypothetical protein